LCVGVAVDLTAADTMMFTDEFFSKLPTKQCEGRLGRLCQLSPAIFFIFFVVTNSVEAHIRRMTHNKEQLNESLTRNASFGQSQETGYQSLKNLYQLNKDVDDLMMNRNNGNSNNAVEDQWADFFCVPKITLPYSTQPITEQQRELIAAAIKSLDSRRRRSKDRQEFDFDQPVQTV
jgi:hypothetical protein